MIPAEDFKMIAAFNSKPFPEYLKSLGQVELSEACEAILSEFRRREAEKIKIEALRKLRATTQ
jgi:hypothetical protein